MKKSLGSSLWSHTKFDELPPVMKAGADAEDYISENGGTFKGQKWTTVLLPA